MAFNKYKLTGLKPDTITAVKTLINDVLKPTYDNYIWMGWRKEKLWTLEVDDVLKANMTALTKVYKFYFISLKRKTLLLEDCVSIFTSEVELDLLPEQIEQCWGLSKMTVNNDIKQRKNYTEAPMVEFLECFARVAEAKFKEGPNKNLSLVEKIELLMDLVFPIVNMKRKEVVIEIEYVSVSEEDLVEDRYFI